ncbi:helicase [Ralstonia holmesii]|uniref:helicase n=1 Tax=Ralstonia TaxID=48736 RepID=UPI001EF823EF|nr:MULTISPECIES: helicase [Ralstonia]
MNKDPACADYVSAKDLTFQIRTLDGIGRYFIIRNGKINSNSGLTNSPKFTMTFRDAAKGFAILSAKDSKDAFLTALHRQDLDISGDFLEVMWFQGLTEYLKPAKQP